MKEKFERNIEFHLKDYKAMVKDLFDHPEVGNQEFQSSKKLTDLIKKMGFAVEYPYICPTGFKGEYKAAKAGPTIGFLCEYDALPEVGHGCGHNLIGVMSIAAAVALKEVIEDIGGKIVLFGTPAEENFGGKVEFANHHAFDQVDVAMMLHPATCNQVGARTNALYPVKFEFFGVNAHGAKPFEGRSALDAAVLTYTGISMLRQYCKPNTYIHGVIKNGGSAANVIPAYASMEYYFRAPNMNYAKEIASRAITIAQGAAHQAEVKMEHSIYECPYEDKKINYTLSHKLKQIYESLGLEDILDVNEIPGGSSDVGAVSYVCPTIEGQIKIAEACVRGHSKEMALATIQENGTKAIVNGGSALALLAYDFITDTQFAKDVMDEFQSQK